MAARPGVFGGPADKLARMAVIEQEERRRGGSLKETRTPPVMQLVLAALGGVFLLMASGGALWAWLGAAAFMTAMAGASPGVAAGAGALACAIAYFRVLGSVPFDGEFWLVMILYVGAGALAGVLISVISNRLPAPVFPFLAALVPAGFEHLASFGLNANLLSTSLTQYLHPAIVAIARPAGLAGVTFVIFLFGAAVAAVVRYAREPSVIPLACGPALVFVVAALIYGAISSASTGDQIATLAFNFNSHAAVRRELLPMSEYDAAKWSAHIVEMTQQAGSLADKPLPVMAGRLDDQVRHNELMVWPEAAAVVNAETKDAFLSRLKAIASTSGCAQVATFYDFDSLESRVVVTGINGDPAEGYARRRFAGGADNVIAGGRLARAGKEPPKSFITPSGKIGALLSLDANYFGNFASIARDGGRLVAVCGNDDLEMPQVSLRLLVFNASRSGMAVVRSAGAGTLMAISPNGNIIDDRDASGASAVLEARVPLGTGRTVALAVGDAFAWLALLGGVVAGLVASSRPDPNAARARAPRANQYGSLKYRTKNGQEEV